MNGVRKRSVTIRGHRTSYSVEDAFFDHLREIAEGRGMPLAALVGEIDANRARSDNLSSALRLFVLDQVKRDRSDCLANEKPDQNGHSNRRTLTG